MITLLSHCRRLLMRLNALGAGAMMALVFGLVFTNAFGRYTLGTSITWGEDIAIFAMIFGVVFGTALAYLDNGHVRFHFIAGLVPRRWRPHHAALVDLLVLVVGIGLAVSAFEFMSARGGRESPSTGIPMAYFQFAMLLGGVLLALSATTMGLLRLTGGDSGEADR